MKNAMEAHRFCQACKRFVNTEIRKSQTTLEVKGKAITVDTLVRCCCDCGAEVFDRDMDDATLKAAYAAYRKEMGLLQPEEITRIREKYGLSQVTFARVLGLGDKTVHRYENGSLQDEAQNNLILLVEDRASFKKLFDKNRARLTEDEQRKVEQALFNIIEYEPRPQFRIIIGGEQEWEELSMA